MKNQDSSDDTHPIKNYKIMLKFSIIDGADQVNNLSNTNTVRRNVLSFLKEHTKMKKLHIDGSDFY